MYPHVQLQARNEHPQRLKRTNDQECAAAVFFNFRTCIAAGYFYLQKLPVTVLYPDKRCDVGTIRQRLENVYKVYPECVGNELIYWF